MPDAPLPPRPACIPCPGGSDLDGADRRRAPPGPGSPPGDPGRSRWHRSPRSGMACGARGLSRDASPRAFRGSTRCPPGTMPATEQGVRSTAPPRTMPGLRTGRSDLQAVLTRPGVVTPAPVQGATGVPSPSRIAAPGTDERHREDRRDRPGVPEQDRARDHQDAIGRTAMTPEERAAAQSRELWNGGVVRCNAALQPATTGVGPVYPVSVIAMLR